MRHPRHRERRGFLSPMRGELLQPRRRDGDYSLLRPLGNFTFVPLVTVEMNAVAEMSVTILRPEPPAAVASAPASESGRLCHGDGAPAAGRVLELPTLRQFGLSLSVKSLMFASLDPERPATVSTDAISVRLLGKWHAPFTVMFEGPTQLARVEFSEGVLSWDRQSWRVSVQEGTKARVEGVLFRHLSGVWQPVP